MAKKNGKLELYLIDLSMVVSKYIGETEKNVARLFNAADEPSFAVKSKVSELKLALSAVKDKANELKSILDEEDAGETTDKS